MATVDPTRRRVVVIGPVNVDLFIRGEAPLDREQLNRWVGPADVQLLVAGSIGYTIQALARLGWKVEAWSTTGDDAVGTVIRDELTARGIDCRHLVQVPGTTAIAIYVMLFGGQKRPMTYRLPSFEPWPDPPPALDGVPEPPSLLHSGGLLHFPGMWHRGMAALFERARADGITTSIDPQFPLIDTPAPWLPHVADVVRHADVLLCDEGEARMLFAVDSTEAAIRRALSAGPRIVAIKRGAAGSLVSDGRVLVDQPAVPIDPARVGEAVGAGDAFDAGFLDAILDGDALDVAARRATATAYLSLSGRGGAEGIAGRDAVTAALLTVPEGTCRQIGDRT